MMMQANGYMPEQFDMRPQQFLGDLSQGKGYEHWNGGGYGYDEPTPDLATALEAAVNFMAPIPEEQHVHSACIHHLQQLARQVGPGWEVKAFGSAANGFLSRGADLDVTCYKGDIQDQDSQMALQELRFRFGPLLGQQPQFQVIQEVWSARVPIIKLRYMDIIDVDLSCHNPQALQNTHLLQAYSTLSPRIRKLVLCVKCWAKAENVCGAPLGHLSSYAFAIMVIYFLQVEGTLNLPCLPVSSFSSQGSTFRADSSTWICQRPLVQLLTLFFHFYANKFAWGSEVVSIRTGRRMNAADPEYANLPGRQVHRLHVEDPFISRNLNCVLSPENEEFLKSCLLDAYVTIQQSEVPKAFLQASPQEWLRRPADSHPPYHVRIRGMAGMQVGQGPKQWYQHMGQDNHQRFAHFPARSYGGMRYQHKALPLQPHDARGNMLAWNGLNHEVNGHNNHNWRPPRRHHAVQADWNQLSVSDSSFQRELREPKYPPPDKPPKRSPVVQIPSVPNVPKVPNDNVSAQQKVEKSWDDPETPNAAKSEEKKKVEKPADLPEDNPEGRTSSALAWLEGPPKAPVEEQIPVPKFGR